MIAPSDRISCKRDGKTIIDYRGNSRSIYVPTDRHVAAIREAMRVCRMWDVDLSGL